MADQKKVSQLPPASALTGAEQILASQAGASVRVALSDVTAKALSSNVNVNALAGLAGVADRLPYFTGAGALSLANLTAFARTLLDDTNAAAAQATLGLVPTVSTMDSTLGRLLRVGDFGVGQLQLETAADANAVAATGLTRLTSSSLNAPSGVTVGVLLNAQQTASVGQQMVIAPSGVYIRSQTAAATYTAWAGPLQVSSASLSALAALTPAANQVVRYTSASAAVMQSFTTGAQALAALTYAADRIGYSTSASAAAVTALTAFGRSLIDDADAATARATLGVTPGAWTNVTLVSSWTVISGRRAAYRAFLDMVQVEIGIQSGTATDGTTLFTLPTGFRPAFAVAIVAASGASTAIGTAIPLPSVVISPDGTAKCYNCTNNPGINFSAILSTV